MRQKSKTIKGIYSQKSQPEAKCEAGQDGEIYPFSATWFFIGPVE
jgi:hypothetical protein